MRLTQTEVRFLISYGVKMDCETNLTGRSCMFGNGRAAADPSARFGRPADLHRARAAVDVDALDGPEGARAVGPRVGLAEHVGDGAAALREEGLGHLRRRKQFDMLIFFTTNSASIS